MDFDDLEFEIDSSDKAKEIYEQHFQNKFNSNCSFLQYASLSSFRTATEGFSKLITLWQDNADSSKEKQAEIRFVISLHYSMQVLGPVLSSVLFPVFSIESFIRSFAENALTETTVGPVSWRLALEGIDKKNFEERIETVLRLTETNNISKSLMKKIRNLIAFRNDIAHDNPI